MARYKKGMIGPKRKTKRYDKIKRENELEKLRLENIEMLQKKPEKGNLKLYSNIRVIPTQPKKEEVSIMDSGQTFTEEELKKKLEVKKVKSEYEEPIDPNNRKTDYKNTFEGEPYLIKSEEEHIEKLKRTVVYLTKRTMKNKKQKNLTSLKYKMFDFIDKINADVKVKIGDFDIVKKRKFYNEEFNFRSFKKEYLKKIKYPRINKRIYFNRIRKYFNFHKKRYVDYALDYDTVVYSALKRGNVRKKKDLDHYDYGTFEELEELKRLKKRIKK